MPRGWERHPQTGRTLFDWSHYTIYTLTPTNYFFLGEMHKLQISVILAGFFKFSLHWLSEGRGHFPLGKGVLFWLFALKLYFQKLPQQHFKRDLFTRSPIKGFPKHGFIVSPKMSSRGVGLWCGCPTTYWNPAKGGCRKTEGFQQMKPCFCYCKNGWKTCLQSWKTYPSEFSTSFKIIEHFSKLSRVFLWSTTKCQSEIHIRTYIITFLL